MVICQPPIWGKDIALENGRISDFQGLVTLTSDRVTLHTVMRHSSTSTYIPNFVEIEETILDGRTDRHLRPTVLCRLGGVDLIQHVPVAAVYLFSLEFLLQSFALGNLSRRQFLLRLTVLTHQLIQLAVVCSQQHLATHHHFTNLVTGSCSLMIVFSTKPRDWLGRTSLE